MINKEAYDIIIVGSGIAGLTAAIYGARAGKRVLVLEAKVYGGQIVESDKIENYPGIKNISGYDFAEGLYSQAVELGVEMIFEQVKALEAEGELKTAITDEGKYYGRSVIAASGLKKRKLGVEREEELTGKGVSYCATCDGAFYRGRKVAVNGGGNTAVSEALYLSDICQEVYIIHRREEFRAEKELTEKLAARENVKMLLNCEIKKLNGSEHLESIVVYDKSSGKETEFFVEGLFVCIGQVPHSDYLEGIIELDEAGYVVAGEDCHTNVAGVFAAGDCRTKSIRQLVTAAADGAIAAMKACEMI